MPTLKSTKLGAKEDVNTINKKWSCIWELAAHTERFSSRQYVFTKHVRYIQQFSLNYKERKAAL